MKRVICDQTGGYVSGCLSFAVNVLLILFAITLFAQSTVVGSCLDLITLHTHNILYKLLLNELSL